MALPELLQALREEVDRESAEILASADAEAARIIAEAAARADSEIAAKLAERRTRHEEARRRALDEERLEAERQALLERRATLEAVRREAESRLATGGSEALLAVLLDELVPEIGGGPARLRVRPEWEPALSRLVEERLPDVTVGVDADPSMVGGGIIASIGGKRLVDDSIPSRVAHAWRDLEPEIARILFGGSDGGR